MHLVEINIFSLNNVTVRLTWLWKTSSNISKFWFLKSFFSVENWSNLSQFFFCEEYLIKAVTKSERPKNFLAAPKMVSFLQLPSENKTLILVQLENFSALLILWQLYKSVNFERTFWFFTFSQKTNEKFLPHMG